MENAFAVGDGDLVISKAFTWSGPVAAIAAVGVARSAYEYVLKWAKTYTAGGNLPILHHQAVGYLLAEVAMKIEACRAFSWKAAHYLDQYNSDGHAVGAMAKVFCGETLFNAVFRTMQAMGVNALDKTHPIEKFLREAAVFPLYDAGNIGMQMRKIWGVMLDADFDPRAIADSRADGIQEIDGGRRHAGLDRGRVREGQEGRTSCEPDPGRHARASGRQAPHIGGDIGHVLRAQRARVEFWHARSGIDDETHRLGLRIAR